MSKTQNWLNIFVLFFLFGALYYMIEIFYDGSSHWSMFICGGLSGIFGSLITEYSPHMKLIRQAFLITCVILILEYITGYVVNIMFGLRVWDYSNLPLNISGQICLRFAIIWFLVFAPLIIWLSNVLKSILFGAEKSITFFGIYRQMGIEVMQFVIGRETTI